MRPSKRFCRDAGEASAQPHGGLPRRALFDMHNPPSSRKRVDASERATIPFPVRAGEMARIGPAEVRERYGDIHQGFDFIALRGAPRALDRVLSSQAC